MMPPLEKLKRCFDCGTADTGTEVRGGLCLECYCKILNRLMFPIDGTPPLQHADAHRAAIREVDAMREDKKRTNFNNGFGRKIIRRM